MLKFGSNGEGNGQFNAPTGVAVDSNGNIIVADWGNSRIQVVRTADGGQWLRHDTIALTVLSSSPGSPGHQVES